MQTEDGESWHKTWAFPVDENRAGKEGCGQQSIEGCYFNDDSFPGCPCCGAKQNIYTTTEILTYTTGQNL